MSSTIALCLSSLSFLSYNYYFSFSAVIYLYGGGVAIILFDGTGFTSTCLTPLLFNLNTLLLFYYGVYGYYTYYPFTRAETGLLLLILAPPIWFYYYNYDYYG